MKRNDVKKYKITFGLGDTITHEYTPSQYAEAKSMAKRCGARIEQAGDHHE